MGGHSQFLVKEFGLDRETVKSLRAGAGGPGVSAKEAALIGFARKVASGPGQLADADIQELKAAGLEDAEVVEALCVVMLSAFTNTLAQPLKFEDDLERLGMRGGYF